MILLSSPLKNDPPETTVSIFFSRNRERVTTKIVNSKSLKKICRQLLSTMNVLNRTQLQSGEKFNRPTFFSFHTVYSRKFQITAETNLPQADTIVYNLNYVCVKEKFRSSKSLK